MSLFKKKEKREDAKFWWGWMIRGIVAILFGIAAVFWPGITLVTLIYLFAAFILISGLVSVVVGVCSVGKGGWGWLWGILLGMLEIGVGVYLVRHPGVSVSVFVILLAAVFIVRGVIEGVSVFVEKHGTATERTLTIIGAILAVVVGIVLMVYPVGTSVAFVWIVGLFALIEGPILIAMSVDLKETYEKLTAKK